ncbi:unnamed protein product [Schistocephalus solidus]|uniref:Estradiol 17-beta-dehydrogenase 12 n=1 Tax=Schistocephalus solidus TaxID=70667 RepID=A0A3P7D2D7_SCHSO|nr:unnamed protein product [Schistocephalus solidus]
MKRKIEELSSVSILINNVALAYTHMDALATCEDLTLEKLQNMIVCNVTSTTCMTRITLPKMLTSPPPNDVHRYIVNISSLAGCFPTPCLSVYAGTKAFVNNFTASLAGELAGSCVKVQTFTPSLVMTAMSGIKCPSFIAPSPSTFAASALSMLGVANQSCGYLPHELLLTYMLALPRWLRSARFGSYVQSVRGIACEREKSKNL